MITIQTENGNLSVLLSRSASLDSLPENDVPLAWLQRQSAAQTSVIAMGEAANAFK